MGSAHSKNFSQGNVLGGQLVYGYHVSEVNTNNGPTAAGTIDGGDQSKTVTLRSPMQ